MIGLRLGAGRGDVWMGNRNKNIHSIHGVQSTRNKTEQKKGGCKETRQKRKEMSVYKYIYIYV